MKYSLCQSPLSVGSKIHEIYLSLYTIHICNCIHNYMEEFSLPNKNKSFVKRVCHDSRFRRKSIHCSQRSTERRRIKKTILRIMSYFLLLYMKTLSFLYCHDILINPTHALQCIHCFVLDTIPPHSNNKNN